MITKRDMKKVKELARDLYLTPDVQGESAYHVRQIIEFIERRYSQVAGHLTEDSILRWAEESTNESVTWNDLRVLSHNLLITSEHPITGKPWIEVIAEEHRRQEAIGVGAARTLKMQAIGYLATHFQDAQFASPAEAILCFQAASTLLKESQKIKL